MSEYTIDHLAANVLVGYDYNPWWSNEADRRGIDRSVWSRPGAVTLDEMFQRLGVPLELVPMYESDLTLSEYQRVRNPVTGTLIGPPTGAGYVIHQPGEWLAKTVEPLLHEAEKDGLGIATVVQLGDGAKSAVTLQLPEPVRTKAGLDLRPYTCVATSHDQSLATATHNGHTIVVCDNTARAAQAAGLVIARVKHTSQSGQRLGGYRAAVAAFHGGYRAAVAAFHGYAEAVAGVVDADAAVNVTPTQFNAIVTRWQESAMKGETPAAQTRRDNVRDELWNLYQHDVRCAPWKGTVLGVMQTWNTYVTHKQTVRGKHRAERQMERVMTGEDIDAQFRGIVQSVLDRDLVPA